MQLNQAQGQLARDQAQLSNAKLDLQRYQQLSASGVIPQQQLDAQSASVRQFEGVITADQAQIDDAKLQISYCRITAPLSGIVEKNAIMMIDFALEAERTEGKNPRDAIFEACLLRFRPIMMTTMAALLGGMPLALGVGTGSELRRPLGIAIVGGLLVRSKAASSHICH